MRKIKRTSFRDDKFLQQLARDLFKGEETIAVSRGTRGKTIVSYLINDGLTYTNYEKKVIPQTEVEIFPRYDVRRVVFDIIINITLRTKRQVRCFSISIPGEKPLDQNKFLDTISKKHYTEIWKASITGDRKQFTAVYAPCEETVINQKLLQEIYHWNEEDIVYCGICGKPLEGHFEQNICLDCYSRNILSGTREIK